MAIVEELIRKSNEGIDFGNYKLGSKNQFRVLRFLTTSVVKTA